MVAALGQAAVLFDLDGTLTDPFVGITRSIDYALTGLGRVSPPPEDLRWCIGPPLRASFQVLLDTEDDASLAEAVRLYRERYADLGKFENTLIDGIPDTLAVLHGKGAYLSVATSKLKTYAGEIVEHFGLRGWFHVVHGSELDGRNSAKADLIGHILTAEGIDPRRSVMIGDRSHDVVGAAAHGIPTIGVAWGYAVPGELEEAGAVAIAHRPDELPVLIDGVLRRS
ncbi:MAG: HAD hydrolase-like protein [Rhizobiaceae bacterium]|nr:HAD hydrolase-like protein [Rhizobiaceae bacterium]